MAIVDTFSNCNVGIRVDVVDGAGIVVAAMVNFSTRGGVLAGAAVVNNVGFVAVAMVNFSTRVGVPANDGVVVGTTVVKGAGVKVVAGELE